MQTADTFLRKRRHSNRPGPIDSLFFGAASHFAARPLRYDNVQGRSIADVAQNPTDVFRVLEYDHGHSGDHIRWPLGSISGKPKTRTAPEFSSIPSEKFWRRALSATPRLLTARSKQQGLQYDGPALRLEAARSS
jgi:hypothetical protein